jgi:hypothetical protein
LNKVAQQKFWNSASKTTQIDCILLSLAAKPFGIATKGTAFCSAAQQKRLLNCEPKYCILFSHATKILEFSNKNNSNCLHPASCSAVQPKIQEFTHKSNSNFLYFALLLQRKSLEFANKIEIYQQKQHKLTVFCLPRSENFWNCQQKQLKLTSCLSAAQRASLELRPKALYLFSRAAKIFGIVNNSSTVFVRRTKYS